MFVITPEESKKIDEWLRTEVYPSIVAEQRLDPDLAALIYVDKNGTEIPYTGAISSGLTYSFTPTSLGTFIKVSFLNHELDLTEYNFW